MYLGKSAKAKTPGCNHKDWSLEIFRIEWVEVEEDLPQKPHLHCDACGITAKKALSKKEAREFKGYYDKPDRSQVCYECQHRTGVEYADAHCFYDSRDTDLLLCDICGEVIQGVYSHDNYS